MCDNVIFWWILIVFFVFIGVVYMGWYIIVIFVFDFVLCVEWVGIVVFFFGVFMSVMVVFYFDWIYKVQNGELFEDILILDIDDGDFEFGEFSLWFWWLIVFVVFVGVFVVGFVVGYFFFLIGFGIFVVVIVGWVYEYYCGNFVC